MIALEYDYHDASLVSLSCGPRREATFVFDLYPIFYPDKRTISLRFGGILNNDSVAKYVANVTADAADDPDAYLARCDDIQLDAKKPSKDGDIYVFLELDHFGPLRIHCQHLSELKT